MRRRAFVKRCVAGCGAAMLGYQGFRDLVLREGEPGLGLGFRNDATEALDRFSRPAAWAESDSGMVRCTLCPHECFLGENDRGFCRTRVVKGGQLYTEAYGNLCTVAVDPIEKKPLYHFLPTTRILSVATGGCNLRCLNCQNWEISQARPRDVARHEVFPVDLVGAARTNELAALAFTYSEPLVAFEYVRDAAALARSKGIRNVLVTAGYVSPAPLRELCRSIDAVTLDLKAFDEPLFRQLSGGRVTPVLRALEIFREERVWVEVSFLMVPTISDSPPRIAAFAAWVAGTLGRDTPFHVLRFHPDHRLRSLPSTSVTAMEEVRTRCQDAGLRFVYLGNVPGHDANHTRCPRDGRLLIERQGYLVTRNDLVDGRCPCGEPIAGVFS